MLAEIRRVAIQARILGKGILIIGARHNFIGDLQSVNRNMITLRNACVAFDTGRLDSDTIDNFQIPPHGIIVVPMNTIDAVMIGKKTVTST